MREDIFDEILDDVLEHPQPPVREWTVGEQCVVAGRPTVLKIAGFMGEYDRVADLRFADGHLPTVISADTDKLREVPT